MPKIAILLFFLLPTADAFGQDRFEKKNKDLKFSSAGITLQGYGTLVGFTDPRPNLSKLRQSIQYKTTFSTQTSKSLLQEPTNFNHSTFHIPSYSEPRSFVCDFEDFISKKANILIDIGPE